MRKSRRLLAIPLVLGVAAGLGWQFSVTPASVPSEVSVLIVPLGDLDAELISDAQKGLETAYRIKVDVGQAQDVPGSAYYPPRNRYRAEKIVEELQELSTKGTKVLGLTSVDISTTKGEHKDWGVIGLALLDGQGCVVSDYRIKGKGSEKLYRERWMKTVIHEVGHSLGLDHCTASQRCPMQEYEGSIRNTDRSGMLLCTSCRAKVKAAKEPKIA
jgi:archaemetzincin